MVDYSFNWFCLPSHSTVSASAAREWNSFRVSFEYWCWPLCSHGIASADCFSSLAHSFSFRVTFGALITARENCFIFNKASRWTDIDCYCCFMMALKVMRGAGKQKFMCQCTVYGAPWHCEISVFLSIFNLTIWSVRITESSETNLHCLSQKTVDERLPKNTRSKNWKSMQQAINNCTTVFI